MSKTLTANIFQIARPIWTIQEDLESYWHFLQIYMVGLEIFELELKNDCFAIVFVDLNSEPRSAADSFLIV